MRRHLQEYIGRLKSYSKRLDNFAILLDQPWLTKISNENSRCVFIFRRENNELLMSLDGKVERAKWEYMPAMNSLLIERKEETVLYNQGFFDESIMILKRDGADDFQLFVNENKVTSTIEELLEKVEKKYLSEPIDRIVRKKLRDGRYFDIYSSLAVGYTVGDKVRINGQIPLNGEYKFGLFDSILVEDGKIWRL